MKTRIVIGSLVATVMSFQALAQRAENDDLYFNKKDREKLKAENASVPSEKSVNDKIDSDYNAFRKAHFDKTEEKTDSVNNPTDSFSARNVNPEYISRSNSAQASEDEQNCYVEGYAANNTDSYSANNYSSSNYNNGNYNNGNYNNNYGNYNNSNWNNSNGYYGSNYGYSPYNSLYSPYYGSCNPWMSPYYGGTGLTMSLNYMFGSPGWNYGMNYGYGYGNSYNPYNTGYYSSGYSPYSNYGYPTNNYSSGSTDSNTHYGKRPSRHSAVVTPTPRYTQQSSNTNGGSNGRTRQPVDEYYVKPFRRTYSYDNSSLTSPSSTGGSRYSRPTSTDYPASRTRESYSSPTRESRSSYSTPSYSSPSRSSSMGSSPGRSSGGGSMGGSRSRGH
jgi:hypothetical protein